MKTATRLVLGIVSTFLLTAGFARAAEQFDPVSNDVEFVNSSGLTDYPPPPCSSCEDDNPE